VGAQEPLGRGVAGGPEPGRCPRLRRGNDPPALTTGDHAILDEPGERRASLGVVEEVLRPPGHDHHQHPLADEIDIRHSERGAARGAVDAVLAGEVELRREVRRDSVASAQRRSLLAVAVKLITIAKVIQVLLVEFAACPRVITGSRRRWC
jgi:hypothetical protein